MCPTCHCSQPCQIRKFLVPARGAVAELTAATLESLGLGNGDNVDGDGVEL